MNKLCLVLVLFSLLLGCVEKDKETKEMAKASVKNEVDSMESTEDTLAFPVYSFKELEPLLHQNDGQTYVINFWATWCKPCLAELPHFERIYAEQQENGVKVILVNLDLPHMWKSRLEPYVKNKGIQSEVVILDDPNQKEWIPKVAKEWGGGIPATLLYNKDKRSFFEKGFTYEELNSELHKFLE